MLVVKTLEIVEKHHNRTSQTNENDDEIASDYGAIYFVLYRNSGGNNDESRYG
jgi:hypothetical protein